MSNPNDDSNKEPIKPLSKGLKMQVQRTVSAGVTFENAESSEANTQGGDAEISKLRVNATPFVPKHRRAEGTVSTTTNLTAPATKSLAGNYHSENLNTTSNSTTTGNLNPVGATTQTPQNYPSSKYFLLKDNLFHHIETANYTQQQSYLPYTYIGSQGMYGAPIQPNINMFPGNKPAGGQFYPGYSGMPNMSNMPPMTMASNMPYGQYPMSHSYKYPPVNRMPITTQTPIANPQDSTSTTNISSNYNTTDPKRSSFNKNAQPFYPKNFKVEANVSANPEEAEQKAENKVTTQFEDNAESQVESSEKEQVIADAEKDNISAEKEAETEVEVANKVDEEPSTQIEESKVVTTITPTPAVTEPAKPEKKTKLDNLFDSNTSVGPAFKPKVQPKDVKKFEKPAAAAPSTTKSKQLDKNKYFDEMSKKLQADKLKQTQPEVKVVKQTSSRRETVEKEIEVEANEELVQKEQEQPRETVVKTEKVEELTKAELEQPSNEQNLKQTIERHYFIVDESSDKKSGVKNLKHSYSVDYMLSFKDWKICREDKLLTDMLQDHIQLMNTVFEEERPKMYKGNSRRESKPINLRQSQTQFQPQSQTTQDTSSSFQRKPEKEKEEIKRQSATSGATVVTEGLGKWGRKDMSEGEKLANEFKIKLDEERKRDPIRNDLIELLNILTVDNYDDVKKQIYEIIKSDVEDQGKFLEVLFKKAVHEKAFVLLYSRLCKDLDRELPQKSEKVADKTIGGKLATRPSIMRSKLLDRCKEIFKTDQDSKVDQYIKVSDPEEREAKMKKFLLGNVNFIGELINTKLLSKKIVFQCLNNLFSRVEKSDELNVFFKQINIEAIVILMDKFGTLINKYETKTKPEELLEFTKRIDEYISKLDWIAHNDKDLPGYIRYKIINLIEKRNRGWEESKVDRTVLAQGKNQIKEDIESEMHRTSSSTKSSVRLDQNAVNNKIREDLFNWRAHVKAGYSANEYTWEITDALVRKHKNTIGEILTAFGETCIDFIHKTEDIQTAYLYIHEIITYFFKKLTINEKNEINQVALFWLENINDFAIDNNLLINIWGGTIYLLDYFNIFSYGDIDKLTNLTEDQLKAIFEVIKMALSYYEDKEAKMDELLNIPIFQANKELFLSLVKSSN